MLDQPPSPVRAPSPGISLSTAAPQPGEHRLAGAAVVVSVIAFLAAAPFARVPLPTLPAFIAVHQAAIAISGLMTAALLLTLFWTLGSAALLAISIGYLITGFMAAAQLLTYPGMFAPDAWGVAGAGRIWLYLASHAIFALAILAYALLRRRTAPRAVLATKPVLVVVLCAGLALALTLAVAALTDVSAVGLPALVRDNRYLPTMLPLAASVWTLNVVALITLWRRKPHAVLDLWLMVATCAWLFDIALSTMLNAGRFDFGYYVGRTYGVLASMFVLIVLLAESARASARGVGHAEQNAADARSQLAGIIDSAMDAIITVDDHQRVVLLNATAVTLFGCPRDEAVGAPLERFLPERYRTAHAEHVRRFGEGAEQSRRMGSLRIVTGLRASGEEFPIDASISQVSVQGRKYYTVILRDVTERQNAMEALQRSREELRQLASVGATAREQEKSRIARELHDELAQSLAMLRMDVVWIRERAEGADPAARAKLAAMQKLLDESVAATRRIAADLRPLVLDDLGLVAAIEWLTQKFTERYQIECKVTIDPPDIELADPYATAVFRIVQEALTNVARHAGATRVTIEVRSDGKKIALRVEDDGRGFDVTHPRKATSFGLVGLRERVHLVDGFMTIDSAPGHGTRISVRVPLPAEAAPGGRR